MGRVIIARKPRLTDYKNSKQYALFLIDMIRTKLDEEIWLTLWDYYSKETAEGVCIAQQLYAAKLGWA